MLPYFLPDAAAGRPDDAPPHPRPYFLFVGRLVRTKGLHTILAPFRRTGRGRPRRRRRGHQAAALRAAAADMPNVTFLGAQPYERLRALYRHAIALVVPSVCYEVFPMVILEAFAESTPVVARDGWPAWPKAVNDSGGGLLFSDEAGLRSALDRLQADPVCGAAGRAGRRTFRERWTADAHIGSTSRSSRPAARPGWLHGARRRRKASR